MYNIQSIVMEYKWIVLVMVPEHESENHDTCAALPPRGESGSFLHAQMLSEKKREMTEIGAIFSLFPPGLLK